MSTRTFLIVLILGLGCVVPAMALAGSLELNASADGDSTYFEHFSDGFVRMDLYSPMQPTHQSFHAISDPETIYNQNFDGFPNDQNLRLGSLEFDESGLEGGDGTAPITGLVLGIATDPADPGYENWRRFATTTVVNEFSGSVEVRNGAPIAVELTGDVSLLLSSVFGATITGEYSGTFMIDGNHFEFQAEGNPVLDTLFGTAEVPLEWDFSGMLTTYSTVPGDYDHNGLVEQQDYNTWVANFGKAVAPGSDADGNGNGLIDAADYVIWRREIGASEAESRAAAGAVPEPATLALGLWLLATHGGFARRTSPH